MPDAQKIPRVLGHFAARTRATGAVAITVLTACTPFPQPQPQTVELLLIPAIIAARAGLSPQMEIGGIGGRVPLAPLSSTTVQFFRMDVPRGGGWITGRVTLPADSFPYSIQSGVLAFGGRTRAPVAVLRVLQADSGGLRAASLELRHAVAAGALRTLVIVPEGLGARDTETLLAVLTGLAPAARAGGAGEVIVAVAGADTSAYPSRLLATVADGLLIGLDAPAPAAAPGPLITLEEMRRIVGLRASEIGRARLVLLLPTHGYLWSSDSPPRPLSFEEGVRIAAEWRTSLQRDPASDALFARASGRGELWLADSRVVARLAREARAMGIRRFAVVLGAGEDAAVADSLAAGLQTTNSAR